MAGPPPHLAGRRAERRAQLRRRRMLTLAGVLGVCAVLVAVIASSGGGQPSRAASHTASSAGHGHARRSARHRASTGTRGVVASANATIARLASYGLPVYCAGPHGNAVAFTFDDGPGPYTHLALRKLREAGERATFFVVGRSIDAFPGYLPQEEKVAAIGDHSYTHPVLSALPEASVRSELARTLERIKTDSGGVRAELFRPPYGARSAMVDGVAKSLGLLEIVWNIDSADSLGANYAQITANVEAGLHPGSIILMHENRGQTIRALTALLPELHRRHMRSVSLPELLASDPPSLAQLQRGPAGCSSAHASHAGSGG